MSNSSRMSSGWARPWLGIGLSMLLVGLALGDVSMAAEVDDDELEASLYAVHIGDKLNIQVYKEKDLSGSFTVYPSGKINYPLLGEIYVDSLSLEELKRYLAENLSQYLVNPQIHIEVDESPSKSIAVLGQVNRPGNYIISTNMNLIRLISQVGGFSANADLSNVRIVRSKGDQKKNIIVDVNRVMRGEMQDVMLMPGDIIYVDKPIEDLEKNKKAEALSVSILGQVARPGNFDYVKGLSLVKLLSNAGGFTNVAAPNRVKLIRKPKSAPKSTTRVVDVRKILDGKLEDIYLEPNDVVVVPESFF